MSPYKLVCIVLLAACQTSSSLSTANCKIVIGGSTQYQVTGITLPNNASDLAASLDNWMPRNALGSIVALMNDHQLDPQQSLDTAFATGTEHLTVELLSPSAAADVPGGAGAILTQWFGEPAVFCGVLKQGHFQSAVALNARDPYVEGDFLFSFLNGLREHGVALRLAFDFSRDGVLTGILNGAIPGEDMRVRVPGAIAALLTQKIQTDPTSLSTQTILQEFDGGGRSDYYDACVLNSDCMSGICGNGHCTPTLCSVPCAGCNTQACQMTCRTPTCRNPSEGPRAGDCASPNDRIIDTCELTTDRVAALLEPDVSLFDMSGRWNPDSQRRPHDGFSFGVALRASQR